ncbi:MAG: hypothetical protein SOZ80_02970 [Prevotella sp.]|uniref:hypothetical protein n=1 Tax=Prevotella sp. TaxID=59823 RepID=UPI002A28954A|nr:hypothetical protein [Prevotella sp.]MDD7318269.1 hypothetical protein [Prevotellaceae bacterium]MDY4019727.1 hypothetical protein [Prevotella sp.]
MKKFFLSILLLSSMSCVLAQNGEVPFHEHEEDAGLFLGGSLTYWNNNDGKPITLQLFPEAGWRFNHTWAAGVMLGFGFNSDRSDGVKKITRVYKVSPFVRYYYMHRGPFNLYLDGGVGFNHTSPEQSAAGGKRNGYEIGVRPGVCLDLAKGFCLCMRLGFAGYRNNYFVGEEDEIGDHGFGLRFAPEELMIGLELEF